MAGTTAMIKSAAELESRVNAAFAEAATSDDVGRLLPEVEGAASSADASPGKRACERSTHCCPAMK
jgi:hypothetical protein